MWRGGHFAKDCHAPPLKQKLRILKQQGYVLGEVQDEPKNDEEASAQKEALALPSP
jgi:monomeric isocitrate dehydrogenase